MMQWKKDLESLVEQTKAMVKQVNLKQVNLKPIDLEQVDPKQAEPKDVASTVQSEPPLPDPAVKSAMPVKPAMRYRASLPHQWAKPELTFDRPAREEIIQRVEGFRAHQEKLRREREDYYLEMTEKMRAILRDDIERKH